MKQLFHLDKVPSFLPESIKPLFRPLSPVYSSLKNGIYRRLSEQEMTTPYGITLLVEPSNYVERSIAEGKFEAEYVDYFIDFVEDTDTVFYDIGANIGFFSLLHAQRAGDSSVTVAFEPLPRNVSRLKKNVALNPPLSIDLHEVGLSNANGRATLSVSDDRPGEASLTGQNVTSDTEREITISLSKLDGIDESLPAEPDIVKIDVEGAEFNVLDGMESLLCKHQPDILLELHPELLRAEGRQTEDIRTILKENGYTRVYHVERDQEQSLAEFGLEAHSAGNHFHFS